MAIQTYPIVAGGRPDRITTRSAGENARLTFDGQAGQRIALRMSGVTIGTVRLLLDLRLDLQARRDRRSAPRRSLGTNGGFVDTRTLPATGTYTILVDPQRPRRGTRR